MSGPSPSNGPGGDSRCHGRPYWRGWPVACHRAAGAALAMGRGFGLDPREERRLIKLVRGCAQL